MLRVKSLLFLGFLGFSSLAFAHTVGEASGLVLKGTFEPWVIFLLALSIVLYAIGLTRVWSKTLRVPMPLLRQATAFFLGWLAMVVALVSPLDALGAKLFWAHMLQHEIMMIVAAPLLVLGRPFGIWLWALPHDWRRTTSEFVRIPPIAIPWMVLTNATVAWLLHGAALWLWHVPEFFQAALANNGIHTFQHLSFLITALFFWWTVLGEGSHHTARGLAMVYLFTTMIHTGALGALLTFSGHPWYQAYYTTSLAFGLAPIEDQQLGGLIMWIPGGLAYIIAALVLIARYMSRKSSQRLQHGFKLA